MALAVMMYAQDFKQTLPPLKTIERAKAALSPYVRDEDIFTQPDTKQPYKTNPILSGKKMAHISDAADMILFYEAKPAPDCVATSWKWPPRFRKRCGGCA